MFEYIELAMSIVKLDANMLLPNQPMKFPRKNPTNIPSEGSVEDDFCSFYQGGMC